MANSFCRKRYIFRISFTIAVLWLCGLCGLWRLLWCRLLIILITALLWLFWRKRKDVCFKPYRRDLNNSAYTSVVFPKFSNYTNLTPLSFFLFRMDSPMAVIPLYPSPRASPIIQRTMLVSADEIPTNIKRKQTARKIMSMK